MTTEHDYEDDPVLRAHFDGKPPEGLGGWRFSEYHWEAFEAQVANGSKEIFLLQEQEEYHRASELYDSLRKKPGEDLSAEDLQDLINFNRLHRERDKRRKVARLTGLIESAKSRPGACKPRATPVKKRTMNDRPIVRQ